MTNIDPSPLSATASELNRQWLRFQRYWAMAVFSLLVATWRLWLRATEFPRVPMVDLPSWFSNVDSLAIAVIVASLAVIALSERHQQICHRILIASFLLAFVFNQHRLQPWAYQAVLYSVAFATMNRHSLRTWFTAITASIYIYSAWGKFDFQFLHTVGQEFVATVLGPMAEADRSVSTPRLILAASLPIAELAIGLGICFLKTRRAAGLAAMLMHGSLVAVLGPWNLDHSFGVLAWNFWLLLQAWLLFVSPVVQTNSTECEVVTQRESVTGVFSRLVLIAAMLLPLLERAGYWDHWLSWSLYAPHTSRVEIEVHDTAIGGLPLSIRPFVAADEGGWHRILIDRWSLQSVGVPIYPQARFQLGVARSIANEITSRGIATGDGIRVKVRSAADRWTGVRKERWLQGKVEIDQAAGNYWLLGAAQ